MNSYLKPHKSLQIKSIRYEYMKPYNWVQIISIKNN